MQTRMKTVIDWNESEIDLIACEHFLKVNLDRFYCKCLLKPGSHERHKHINNANKARLLFWDLRRQNNKNFSLFRLLFCSWSYAYDDPYVAGLTSFLCFAFCFAVMLMLSCEPGLRLIVDVVQIWNIWTTNFSYTNFSYILSINANKLYLQ